MALMHCQADSTFFRNLIVWDECKINKPIQRAHAWHNWLRHTSASILYLYVHWKHVLYLYCAMFYIIGLNWWRVSLRNVNKFSSILFYSTQYPSTTKRFCCLRDLDRYGTIQKTLSSEISALPGIQCAGSNNSSKRGKGYETSIHYFANKDPEPW